MKYILILLLIFGVANAQTPTLQQPNAQGGWTNPNSGAYGVIQQGLIAWKTLGLPTGNGAPSGTQKADVHVGLLYMDSTSGNIYKYNPKTLAWTALSSGGGGGTGSDTAHLNQGFAIMILNEDSTYKPNGSDVTIAVDTFQIHSYINQVISNDTTIGQIINNPAFIVKYKSNAPVGGDAEGDKYLVDAAPTGTFTGHANQIATKVGGVYTYETPTQGDQLILDNPITPTYAGFQFNGSTWQPTNVIVLAGGNSGIGSLQIGTIDAAQVLIKTKNTTAISVDTLQNVYLPKFTGLEDSNLFFKPGLNGLVDTGHFHQLIAGDNITIVGDTISSTGGAGSQDLQSVTDIGFTTTNPLISSSGFTAADDLTTPNLVTSVEPVNVSINNLNTTASISLSAFDTLPNILGRSATGRAFILTSDGITPPSFTTTGRDAITTDLNQFQIIGNTVTGTPQWYDGAAWQEFGGSGAPTLFPTTGTGTATGDVTGDLDGHDLSATNIHSGIFEAVNGGVHSGWVIDDTHAAIVSANGTNEITANANINGNQLILGNTNTLTSEFHRINIEQDSIVISANPLVAQETNIKILQLDSSNADANNVLWMDADNFVHRGHITAGGGGTTTNALTFNNSGLGDASGTTFNGSSSRTLSYNSIGAVPSARTLTINGTALDLSADRSWTVSAGSAQAYPVGQIVRGTGAGSYSDTFLITDTTKHWLSINRQTPRYVFDVNAFFPGTVSVTNGSTAVIGTGTRFTTNFKKGDTLLIGATSSIVSVILNDAGITLSAVYAGTTNATAAYSNKSTAAGVLAIKSNQRLYSGGYQLASWGGSYGSTYFGLGAGSIDSTGTSNSAFGVNALQKVNGSSNTAIGANSLSLLTSGANNTAIGYNALSSNVSVNGQTAIGAFALTASTSAQNNLAVGYLAISTSNPGSNNSAVGFASGRDITGSDNTFTGSSSGQFNTTGSQNTAIGSGAGQGSAAVTGSRNTYIGYFSGKQSVSNTDNVGIGYRSLDTNTVGVGNVAIGSFTGFRTRGSNNIAIGYNALGTYTTGSNNISIGKNRATLWNASNTANIFGTIFITNTNDPSSSDSAASSTSLTGINTIAPAYPLDVNGTTKTLGFITAYTSTGSGITLTASHHTVEVTATGQTITLPTAVGATGRVYIIKLTASGSGTVATTSSQTIDAATTYSLSAQYKYVQVQSNGANWVIIANN